MPKKSCISAVVNTVNKLGRIILGHRPGDQSGKFPAKGTLYALIRDLEDGKKTVLANYVQVTVPDTDQRRAVAHFGPATLPLRITDGPGPLDGLLSITLTGVSPFSIVSATFTPGTPGTVTVTTATPNNFQANTSVTIAGVTIGGNIMNGYNGVFTILNTSQLTNTTFQYFPTTPPTAASADPSTGTANPASNAIQGISQTSDGTVTVSMNAPHGFDPNNPPLVTIANFTTQNTQGYNGTFQANVTGLQSFTYSTATPSATTTLPPTNNTGTATAANIPVQQDAPVEYISDPNGP